MKWTIKKSLLLCSIFIIVLTISGLGSFGSSNRLTEGGFDQEIGKIFSLYEFTKDVGQLQNCENTFSIDSIPSGWNISEMEINFTNIAVVPENLTIEDSGSSFQSIFGYEESTYKRIAMELVIENSLYLDALEIYCYQIGSPYTNVFVQIEGYNTELNRPNGTLFGTPVSLNTTNTPGWYLQEFSSPIFLEAGKYFVVLEGREMGQASSEIRWRVNNYPDEENLYSTMYWFEKIGDEYWITSTQASKFDCKIHYRQELEIWPEDIGMGISIAGREFVVNNSLMVNVNHGRALIENVPYYSIQPALQVSIPFNVFTSKSYSLTFDIAYSLKLNNTLYSKGYLRIIEGQPNQWEIFPNISQKGTNHTVILGFEEDWYNFTVSRNSTSINDEVVFSNNFLTILNSSIDTNSDWIITANSPQHIGNFDTSSTTFTNVGNVNISLTLPITTGTVEIFILNSSSVEIYRECRNITDPSIAIIPDFNASIVSGIYTMYAQYSNETIAGITSFTFYIDNNPQSFWEKYSGFVYIGGTLVAVSMTIIFSSVAIKRHRVSLLQYRTRLEQTFQSVEEGIIVVDTMFKIRSTNQKAQQMASRMNTRLIGENVNSVFRFEDSDNVIQTSNLVKYGIESLQIRNYFGEFYLTNEGGFRTPVSITVTPVKNQHDEISEIIISFRDISQLLSAQKEFEKRHELETIGLVAAGIAHDFNNMLTAAIGSVSVAKLDEGMEEDNKELLQDAENALINATDLTHQLMTVSKGGTAVQKSGNIVEIVKETVRFVLRGTNIGVDFKVGSKLYPVNFNIGQICQVFNNLVINAREAMPDGGSIIISFVNTSISQESPLKIASGKYVKISVTDQGTGIPTEVLPFIFEPYYTTKPTGNGLGLPTTLAIILKHNGTIDVDSKVGKGTTFRIYLPAFQKNENEN